MRGWRDERMRVECRHKVRVEWRYKVREVAWLVGWLHRVTVLT